MTPQEKAKAAISQLPRLYGEFDSGMQKDKGLHGIIIGLELLRQIANGTHVIVPVEPTEKMMNHFSGNLFAMLGKSKQINEYEAYRRMINEVE
jgi:hypothetical protein